MKNEAFGRVNKNHTIWKILSTKSAQNTLLEDKKKKKKFSSYFQYILQYISMVFRSILTRSQTISD